MLAIGVFSASHGWVFLNIPAWDTGPLVVQLTQWRHLALALCSDPYLTRVLIDTDTTVNRKRYRKSFW